jgi:hypothetical protein
MANECSAQPRLHGVYIGELLVRGRDQRQQLDSVLRYRSESSKTTTQLPFATLPPSADVTCGGDIVSFMATQSPHLCHLKGA